MKRAKGSSLFSVRQHRIHLHVAADEESARLVRYAGQSQGNPIVSYGPFVGVRYEDIVRLFTEYRAEQFVRMSELARRLNREQLNSCYYLLLFPVMMGRFWAAASAITQNLFEVITEGCGFRRTSLSFMAELFKSLRLQADRSIFAFFNVILELAGDTIPLSPPLIFIVCKARLQ